jgi:hypothetical protein
MAGLNADEMTAGLTHDSHTVEKDKTYMDPQQWLIEQWKT